ncbi:MAG: 30S ribosomal protein S8 [Acidimicrobiia bacterium]
MMTDPIADMFTRIRNASRVAQPAVSMPSSKLKEEIAKILASEGYVDGFNVAQDGPKRTLTVELRYVDDRESVIQGIRRVSTPGRRIYRRAKDLPRSRAGLGVHVISTSQGLLSDREARRRSLGGELICEVW